MNARRGGKVSTHWMSWEKTLDDMGSSKRPLRLAFGGNLCLLGTCATSEPQFPHSSPRGTTGRDSWGLLGIKWNVTGLGWCSLFAQAFLQYYFLPCIRATFIRKTQGQLMGTKLSHPGFCLCLCWSGHLPRGPLCVSKRSPLVHRYTYTWCAYACLCFLCVHFLKAWCHACPLFTCCSSYLIVGLHDRVAPSAHAALKSCSLFWIFLQLSVSPRDKISRSRIARSPETHVFMVFDTICQILLYACVCTCPCVVYGGLCLCLWGVCDVWCEACVWLSTCLWCVGLSGVCLCMWVVCVGCMCVICGV